MSWYKKVWDRRRPNSKFVFTSTTVFETPRFEKSQNPPSLILGKYCPDRSVQGSLNSQLKQFYLSLLWPKSERFWTPRPWQTFFNNTFFYGTSQKPLEIKKCIESNCRSLNFTSTGFHLLFDTCSSFLDIRAQRISKIAPLPKIWGSIGPIILPKGGFRFEANLILIERPLFRPTFFLIW